MEEEPEIQQPTSVEEQLNTETSKPTKLNKNGKPRKQLSPEALERLAKAREKANAMRQQNYAKKLEEKVEKLKIKNDEVLPKKELKEEFQEKELKEEFQEKEFQEKELKEEKPKVKAKGKKKTKIIVEQSSDDSDEFEPNDNVVFVKRISRKKKVPEPVKEPEPQIELPPPEPPRPPSRPELTPQQKLLKSQYEGMFGGAFINQNNLMRRHY
jgi:hypothetical protein